ncbi:MAG: hypothetical protein ACO3JF_09440 [Ilumatobacteraceae bacterium]
MNDDDIRDSMDDAAGDAIEDKIDRRFRRQRKHLWVSQVLEYAIGFAIAWSASRASEPLVPAIVAALVITNAAIVRAPLSAFRVTGPQLHRAFGVALSLAILSAAIFVDVDAGTKALLVIGALAEGFVSVRFGHGI